MLTRVWISLVWLAGPIAASVACASLPKKEVIAPKVATQTGTAIPNDNWKATLAAFRKANKPRVENDIPGESVLDSAARDGFCESLVGLAKTKLPLSGDAILESNRCALTLTPTRDRQKVADVRVVFDTNFFFRKPYAAASYERGTRTLFLPLKSLEESWAAVAATKHEWNHAQIHARAVNGDAMAQALQSSIFAARYKPDGFFVDEVVVNLCDLVIATEKEEAPASWQLEMTKNYIGTLETELLAIERDVKASWKAESVAGVPGFTRIGDGSETRWVGGIGLASSATYLRRVLAQSRKAFDAIETKGAPSLIRGMLVPGTCDP